MLAVYRSPLLTLVPLVTIAFSVWVSLNLLALMTKIPGVHLVNISKIFAIVILYGAGTDYCLFLISRYREELESGFGIQEATGRLLTTGYGYTPLFYGAAVAYLLALGWIHLLVPRIVAEDEGAG